MISDETRQKWDDKIEAIIEACYGEVINFTDWENEFVDSLSITRSKGNDLSHKQSKVLSKIYEKIN